MEDPLHTVCSPVDAKVVEILVKDEMEVKKGQSMFVLDSQVPGNANSGMCEWKKSWHGKLLEERVVKCSVEDAAENIPLLAMLDNEDVLKRYENFKKFDTVVDHSDHIFSAQCSSASFQPPIDWANKIQQEWRILEEHLPETIFVRVYEPRMDILRAVIIGQEGTPYHNGLFFFDVWFPSNYPDSPPRVRYNCHVPGINPHMKECGDVSLYLSDTTGLQEMWVPRTSNMLQLLVTIQGLILNTRPSLNTGWLGLDLVGGKLSALYNENIIIKSLQTMICSMNKPPKNFEDLVVGHFCKHVDDILSACEAHMKGYQVKRLISGKNDGFSKWFMEGVAACIKPLVEAFKKIGLKEVQEFCYQIEEKGKTLSPANASAPVDEDIIDTDSKKRMADEDVNGDLTNKMKDIDIRLDDSHCRLTLRGVTDCVVDKVLVNVGERVEKGKPLFVMGRPSVRKNGWPSLPDKSTSMMSMIRQIVLRNHSLGVGILSMEDVLVVQDEDAENIPMAGLDNEVVLKRYKKFKKFAYVKDHSDHIFSSAIVKPTKDWTRKIKEERKILKEHLPENIFVRVYKSRKDLLRAVIVGRKGTNYLYGLFFFDVFFPSDYPNCLPLVHYHSGGLAINPNLGKCGKVDLSLPKTSGGHETLWVPGTSTILQLLVSIQQRILNETPLFNERTWAIMRGTEFGTQTCVFYNINTLIRSIETMVYIINNTPKNFEDFVVGYFRMHSRRMTRILKVFKKKSCLPAMNSSIKSLEAAFNRIGAQVES